MPFVSPDGAVSGYFLRCEQRKKQLAEFIAEDRHPDGIRGLVAWLYRSARYAGIRDEHISQIITEVSAEHPELHLEQTAADLTEQEVAVAAHPPELDLGQRVSVILNARNYTPHSGEICDRVWHHKDRKWAYFLLESGKRVSKRYYYDNLQPA